ncbi:hypothetical protein VTK73DRAFT_1534 [Phialemonium thermophilum]|uniref:Uncharacterized protein n=1 Tax=Phialemonium thermophilum TaxID=223376 RepID=A0ABR3VT95_9PEZI
MSVEWFKVGFPHALRRGSLKKPRTSSGPLLATQMIKWQETTKSVLPECGCSSQYLTLFEGTRVSKARIQ